MAEQLPLLINGERIARFLLDLPTEATQLHETQLQEITQLQTHLHRLVLPNQIVRYSGPYVQAFKNSMLFPQKRKLAVPAARFSYEPAAESVIESTERQLGELIVDKLVKLRLGHSTYVIPTKDLSECLGYSSQPDLRFLVEGGSLPAIEVDGSQYILAPVISDRVGWERPQNYSGPGGRLAGIFPPGSAYSQ